MEPSFLRLALAKVLLKKLDLIKTPLKNMKTILKIFFKLRVLMGQQKTVWRDR